MVRCVESAYNAPYLPVGRSLGIVNSALSSLPCITVSPLFEISLTGVVHSALGSHTWRFARFRTFAKTSIMQVTCSVVHA